MHHAGTTLAAHSTINAEWAMVLAWGIEAGLITAAEAQADHAKGSLTPMERLGERFVARVAEIIRTAIGVDILGKDVQLQWSVQLHDNAIRSHHYVTFEADRINWLRHEVRRDWQNIVKHRLFCAVNPLGLWDQHVDANLASMLKTFDPKAPDASYDLYCKAVDVDADDGDALFGDAESYAAVMASLTSEPRGSLTASVIGYDEGGQRSTTVQAYLTQVRRFLNRMKRTPEATYSLGDEMGHCEDAVVILPAPGAEPAAARYFDTRYHDGNEVPGNELGIALGAGEGPIWRAVYAVAASAIVIGLEPLLEHPKL